MSEKRVPDLRFKGFSDDWEERKLKELFQPSKNKNNNGLYNQKDILAASLGTELIPKRTFFGLKSTKESVKNYRIVKTGDLIYTKSPIKGFPNGIIRSNKGNVGIVPPLYCVYTLQKDINSSIIQLYFEDKNRLDLYLFPLVNVGARNNVNITDLEFLEGKVTIPKSYEEQSKIVQFMEQLNTTITLHQRKLDLLKEQKKGYLQKMFPKNGAKVPELRFKGFTDAWEQRELGNVVDVMSGKDYKHLNEGNIPVYGTGGFMLNVSEALSLDIDAIGIGRKGTINKPYILKAPFWTVDTLFYCLPKKNYELNFLYSIYQRINWKAKDESTGVPSLSKTTINNVIVNIPIFDEQQKIGLFLKQLDNTIALHQRKLELLKRLKQGLLQQMFVREGRRNQN